MPYQFNPFTGNFDNTIPLENGQIPSSYLPSYVDDVLEYANFASFPVTGETGKIYVAIDTGISYRWTGSIYTNVGVAVPGGSDTEIQFNDGGALGGSADLTWDDTAKELAVGGDINLDDGGTYSTSLQLVTPTANRTISFPDATGTVALVAGASGQVTYNSGGAQAGDVNLTWNATTGLALGKPLSVNIAGAASTPAGTFTGTWFTGGTATTTKPQVLIEPAGATSTAWSTNGTGLGINAASGFSGNLLDLQVNGTSYVKASQRNGYEFDTDLSAVGTPYNFKVRGDSYLDINYANQSINARRSLQVTTGFIRLGLGSYSSIAGVKGLATATQIRLGDDSAFSELQAASLQCATGYTVSTLPGSPVVGQIARVTDGDSGLTFGNTVVNSGAGATPYLVWYNGTNWTVIGV